MMFVKAALVFAFFASVIAIRDAEDSEPEVVPPTQSGSSARSQDFVYNLQHCLSPPCNPFSFDESSGFVDRGLVKYKKSTRFVSIAQNLPIQEKDFKSLMKLESYVVRLVCDKSSACDPSHPVVFSTIDSCWLRQANFQDGLVLHVSTEGLLIGIDYFAEGDPLCSSAASPQARKFQTRCTIPPPTIFEGLVLPVDEQQQTDERGNPKPRAQQEPQGVMGFLKRYWYIILPMVVMMSLSQPAEEAGAQGGARQGAGRQGGGAPPASRN